MSVMGVLTDHGSGRINRQKKLGDRRGKCESVKVEHQLNYQATRGHQQPPPSHQGGIYHFATLVHRVSETCSNPFPLPPSEPGQNGTLWGYLSTAEAEIYNRNTPASQADASIWFEGGPSRARRRVKSQPTYLLTLSRSEISASCRVGVCPVPR